ncbi:hypothetical protein ACFU99_15250 [Streptomyces sp. NPDC057654]|uniref:WXG100 family type VII secretion target n=1 Tax=Streptomyces sp. NPDC057654 TaxID=3346196 RepID=UPI0036956985
MGKFDGESHEALYGMIANAQPTRFSDAETALRKASADINAIGEEFRAHVQRVKWEGEGGDAFRAWGAEMAKQTLVMADYTQDIGECIGHAGKGLSLGQSEMPPVEPCYVDPRKDAERRASSDKRRQEAIQALVKADSYVTIAQQKLDGLKEPNFPLLPSAFSGGVRDAYVVHEQSQGGPHSGGDGLGGGSGRITSLHTTAGPNGGADEVSSYSAHHSGTAGVHHSVDTGRHAVETSGTVIDSTVTAPSPDSAKHIVPDHTGPTNTTGPMVPGPAVPNMLTSPRGNAKFTPGLSGGLPEKSVNTPRSTSVPRIGKSDGVLGGTPAERPAQSTSPRLPRGTVVGEERSPMGRAPMGRAPVGAGGYGAGPGQPGASASIPGRRPASEVSGSSGVPRTPRQQRSEFTQGGSGLVRGTQAAGATPRSRAQAPGKPGRRGGVRPDYLTEDEETWTSGRRDTVPPVID